VSRLLYLFVLSSLLSACGRGYSDYELNEQSFDLDTMKLIQAESGVTLPAGAHGLNFYYKAPIDPAFAAKIRIPKDSEPEMMRTLSAIKSEDVNVIGTLGSRLKWWVPNNAKTLLDRQSTAGNAYLRATLTDEADGTILYLEWATL